MTDERSRLSGTRPELPSHLHSRYPFGPIYDVLAKLRAGGMVVVVDDQDRENEGDLIMAAEFATQSSIAFMIRHTSGILCVSMPGERMLDLDLPQMVVDNTDNNGTAFTVSVDAAAETTTGISASERAKTIRLLANPTAKPEDLSRPGHIFPLRARPGGILERAGHTEAGVDLMRLAGLFPAAVLSEIVGLDGEVKRLPELREFSADHGMPLISIAELKRYLVSLSMEDT